MNNTIPPIWAPGINTEHPLIDKVTGYWPGWDGGGNRIMDLVGNNHAHFAKDETHTATPVWEPTELGVLPTGHKITRYIGGGARLDWPQPTDPLRTYFWRARVTKPFGTTPNWQELMSYLAGRPYKDGAGGNSRNIGVSIRMLSDGAGLPYRSYMQLMVRGANYNFYPGGTADTQWQYKRHSLAMTLDAGGGDFYYNGRHIHRTNKPITESVDIIPGLRWGGFTSNQSAIVMYSPYHFEGPMADMIECKGYAATASEVQYLHDHPWGLCQPPCSPCSR